MLWEVIRDNFCYYLRLNLDHIQHYCNLLGEIILQQNKLKYWYVSKVVTNKHKLGICLDNLTTFNNIILNWQNEVTFSLFLRKSCQKVAGSNMKTSVTVYA